MPYSFYIGRKDSVPTQEVRQSATIWLLSPLLYSALTKFMTVLFMWVSPFRFINVRFMLSGCLKSGVISHLGNRWPSACVLPVCAILRKATLSHVATTSKIPVVKEPNTHAEST